MLLGFNGYLDDMDWIFRVIGKPFVCFMIGFSLLFHDEDDDLPTHLLTVTVTTTTTVTTLLLSLLAKLLYLCWYYCLVF